MPAKALRLGAEWTNDCQGKKDYDAEVLAISTRYWPRGGGFSILDASGFHTNEDQSIRPSAHSRLIVRSANEGDLTLAELDVDGETFEEVAAEVEKWAAQQYGKATRALIAAFAPEKGSE